MIKNTFKEMKQMGTYHRVNFHLNLRNIRAARGKKFVVI